MRTAAAERQSEVRVFVLSPVRIYREGLSHVLGKERGIRVVGLTSSLEEASPLLQAALADVVLCDISMDGGVAALYQLTQYGGLCVLVLGVLEREEEIIACAEAGIAGYVTRDSSVADLVQTIRHAARGEFNCPPHIAAGLLRRVAVLATRGQPQQVSSQPRLTLREREILQLIDQGLSNKEIARRLSIQLATVKNHVHNILEKLGVSRRADAAATIRSHRPIGTAGELAATRARI